MPASTDVINEEYFVSNVQPPKELSSTPRDIANSFEKVYDSFMVKASENARAQGRPLPDNSTILSAMYGWAINDKDADKDDQDQIRTREFINRYNIFIEDFTDHMSVGVETREDIAVKASFNQRLSQSLYVVNRDKMNTQLQRKAEVFISIIEALNISGTPLGIEAKRALAGARAQAGAMEVLRSAGYQIIVPDPNVEGEVETWDVLGLADFVAIPPWGEEIICVDVKGRLNGKKGVESSTRLTRAGGRRYRPDFSRDEDRVKAVQQIKQDILDMNMKGVKKNSVVTHVILDVPTDERFLSRLGEVTDDYVADGIVAIVRGG